MCETENNCLRLRAAAVRVHRAGIVAGDREVRLRRGTMEALGAPARNRDRQEVGEERPQPLERLTRKGRLRLGRG